MRFRELILEYDRQKTFNAMGVKLWARLKSDPQVKTIGDFSRAGRTKEAKLDCLMGYLEVSDPSQNQQYVQWIAQCYAGGTIQLEDLGRVADALEHFDLLKQHRFFKKHPEFSQMADIGRHRGLHALEDFNEQSMEAQNVVRQKEGAARSERVMAATKIILDTPEWKIVVPTTVESSMYWGQRTKWCTATGSHNQFDTYSRSGPLYICIDNATQNKWQFHFETNSFMDKSDRRINWYDLNADFWKQIPIDMLLRFKNIDAEFPMPATAVIRLIEDGYPAKIESLTGTQQVTVLMWANENPELIRKVAKVARPNALATAFASAWHWDQGPILAEEIKKIAADHDDPEMEVVGETTFYIFGGFSYMAIYDYAKHGQTSVWRLADSNGQNDARSLQMVSKMDKAIILEKDDKRWYFVKDGDRFGHAANVADHWEKQWARPFPLASIYDKPNWLSKEEMKFLCSKLSGRG